MSSLKISDLTTLTAKHVSVVTGRRRPRPARVRGWPQGGHRV